MILVAKVIAISKKLCYNIKDGRIEPRQKEI